MKRAYRALILRVFVIFATPFQLFGRKNFGFFLWFGQGRQNSQVTGSMIVGAIYADSETVCNALKCVAFTKGFVNLLNMWT
jgi:hypothetical protein